MENPVEPSKGEENFGILLFVKPWIVGAGLAPPEMHTVRHGRGKPLPYGGGRILQGK